MLKAVIFDFDGTIGDTLPLVIKAIRAGVSPFIGREPSDEEIAATFGPIEEGSIKFFVHDEADYEKGCRLMFDYYDKHHDELSPKPFDGIIELINHLKSKGLITALATGKGKKTCAISLRHYGMENIFDTVVTGSIEGGIKPQMMTEILKKYSLKPQEAIYIGDAPTDIYAARRVGVGIVSVLYGTREEYIPEVKAKHPDAICYSPDEVKTYIDSLLEK